MRESPPRSPFDNHQSCDTWKIWTENRITKIRMIMFLLFRRWFDHETQVGISASNVQGKVFRCKKKASRFQTRILKANWPTNENEAKCKCKENQGVDQSGLSIHLKNHHGFGLVLLKARIWLVYSLVFFKISWFCEPCDLIGQLASL